MRQLQEQVRRMTDEKLERELAYAERAGSGLSGLEAAWVDELRAEQERRREGASAYREADKEDHRTRGT
jgi:hypothetical protein